MTGTYHLMVEIGDRLTDLAGDVSKWSQDTFGTDSERGPVGSLCHLEKEAKEAQAKPYDAAEYADCFLLILDAARRAGLTPLALVKAAQAKMTVNKSRQWPKWDQWTFEKPIFREEGGGCNADEAAHYCVWARRGDGRYVCGQGLTAEEARENCRRHTIQCPVEHVRAT